MEKGLVKYCKRCSTIKSIKDFYRHKYSKDGLAGECKSCKDEINRKFRKTTEGKISSKSSNLKYYYKTALSKFNSLLEIQENRCAICQKSFSSEVRAVVDHDHSCCPRKVGLRQYSSRGGRSRSCGKCIRGILCIGCNAGLGMFNDDPQLLISAIRYLNSYTPIDTFSNEVSLEYMEEGVAYDSR